MSRFLPSGRHRHVRVRIHVSHILQSADKFNSLVCSVLVPDQLMRKYLLLVAAVMTAVNVKWFGVVVIKPAFATTCFAEQATSQLCCVRVN